MFLVWEESDRKCSGAGALRPTAITVDVNHTSIPRTLHCFLSAWLNWVLGNHGKSGTVAPCSTRLGRTAFNWPKNLSTLRFLMFVSNHWFEKRSSLGNRRNHVPRSCTAKGRQGKCLPLECKSAGGGFISATPWWYHASCFLLILERCYSLLLSCCLFALLCRTSSPSSPAISVHLVSVEARSLSHSQRSSWLYWWSGRSLLLCGNTYASNCINMRHQKWMDWRGEHGQAGSSQLHQVKL